MSLQFGKIIVVIGLRVCKRFLELALISGEKSWKLDPDLDLVVTVVLQGNQEVSSSADARPPKSTEFLYLRVRSSRMYRGIVH